MRPFRHLVLVAASIAVLVDSARAADLRPLPLCGSWNTGEIQNVPGYSPTWVMDRIETKGDALFPQFELHGNFQPLIGDKEPFPFFRSYYFPAMQRAAARNLPIALIGQNFSDHYKVIPNWRWATLTVTAPEDSHPWLIEKDGAGQKKLIKICSPFSPGVASWREHGTLIGKWLNSTLVPAYPNPPLVLLCDNNESGIANHLMAIRDYRCPPELKTASREVIEDSIKPLMNLRWSEFRAGLRAELPSAWQSALKFVGYGDFSDGYNGGPNPFISDAIHHEGVTCSVGYTSYALPGRVRSPMVNACNVRWAIEKYRQTTGTDYYLETHFYHTRNVDNLEQWKGMIRGTLWITQSRTARMFFQSTELVTDTLPKFQPLMSACREVRDNPVLKRFWEKGTLLQNRWRGVGTAVQPNNVGFGHPYNGKRTTLLAPGFGPETLADRWFIQQTSADPRQSSPGTDNWGDDLSFTTPVNVFAIAVKEGSDYLIYATAPRGTRRNVKITPCPDNSTPACAVSVTVPVRGAFWLVKPGNQVTKVTD